MVLCAGPCLSLHRHRLPFVPLKNSFFHPHTGHMPTVATWVRTAHSWSPRTLWVPAFLCQRLWLATAEPSKVSKEILISAEKHQQCVKALADENQPKAWPFLTTFTLWYSNRSNWLPKTSVFLQREMKANEWSICAAVSLVHTNIRQRMIQYLNNLFSAIKKDQRRQDLILHCNASQD